MVSANELDASEPRRMFGRKHCSDLWIVFSIHPYSQNEIDIKHQEITTKNFQNSVIKSFWLVKLSNLNLSFLGNKKQQDQFFSDTFNSPGFAK